MESKNQKEKKILNIVVFNLFGKKPRKYILKRREKKEEEDLWCQLRLWLQERGRGSHMRGKGRGVWMLKWWCPPNKWCDIF